MPARTIQYLYVLIPSPSFSNFIYPSPLQTYRASWTESYATMYSRKFIWHSHQSSPVIYMFRLEKETDHKHEDQGTGVSEGQT